MGLDGLRAEEQLLGDLAVGLAVDDAAGDLELALSERVNPGPVTCPWLRAPVDVLAELAQLALGSVAVALCADRIQPRGGELELIRKNRLNSFVEPTLTPGGDVFVKDVSKTASCIARWRCEPPFYAKRSLRGNDLGVITRIE